MTPLDNPAWHSLGRAHAGIGVHHALARRYRREVTPIGAVASPDPAALAALAELTAPDELLYMGEIICSPLPPCWVSEAEKPMAQMILDRPAEASATQVEPVVLTLAHAAEMSELASLTHPGPSGPELVRLGLFLGVREQGRLVAMAGQRFRMPRYVEISSVCTHPDWQGRGLARALMNHLAREIQRQGDTSFLHVLEENTRAAALYTSMGFTLRQRLWARILRRVG